MTQSDIEHLNNFLRGELSAVETYDQAMGKVEEPPLVEELADGRASHEHRVSILREEIRRLGGTPVDDSGVWGNFAKLVEGGAKLFGAKAAIAALEEGEDYGRDDYEEKLHVLSPQARQLIEQRVLPEQLRTHDKVSKLKARL